MQSLARDVASGTCTTWRCTYSHTVTHSVQRLLKGSDLPRTYVGPMCVSEKSSKPLSVNVSSLYLNCALSREHVVCVWILLLYQAFSAPMRPLFSATHHNWMAVTSDSLSSSLGSSRPSSVCHFVHLCFVHHIPVAAAQHGSRHADASQKNFLISQQCNQLFNLLITQVQCLLLRVCIIIYFTLVLPLFMFSHC